MRRIISFLVLLCCISLASCGEPVPTHIEVEITEVYEDGDGILALKKKWHTVLRKKDGTTFTQRGKLGKVGETIIIENPDAK
jgi:hypothetical protein